jgi:diguanylate cyclase (GGDEF)-like protein/PAS domain S-box-containing protein
MGSSNKKYNYHGLLIIGIVIFMEVLENIFFVVLPFDRGVIFLINICIILASVYIVFSLLRGMNKTEAAELHKSKERLRNIFDTLDVAIWSHDVKLDKLLITTGIEKLYGYSLGEFYEDKTLWQKVIHPDDGHVLVERGKRLSQGEAVTSVYRIIRQDGEVRWIQDRGIPTLSESGALMDFNSVLFDITDRKESENRYQSLVEMSPDIIAVYSRGKIDYINEAGCRLFHADCQKDLIGQPISKLIPPSVLADIKDCEWTNSDNCSEKMRFEFQALRMDGKQLEVEMSVMPIQYEGRMAKQIVGRDISERKKAENTIKFMAYHDALTGLPNRNMFRKQLNEALKHKGNGMLAVLFLDLDRFKIINDTKGHKLGDLLLQIVAKRLENAVQADGLVSRQGGDEFIILLENIDKERVKVVAQRILDEFSMAIIINNQEFFVTSSIGISLAPIDGNDEETLIKHADTAMYLAKEHGKNNFQFYTSQLHGLSSRKMELENGLRKALEQGQLALHYQPQVNLETNGIVGIEALMRWQHPEHGFISPAEFIPLAEETGLIVPIGKWALRTACEQNKAWQDLGLGEFLIAVNISVRQLQEEDFVEFVKKVLAETELDPTCLELEITESIMQNIERSTKILHQLKELGVKISIDDFGTGYSSLSYLKHLPIDSIKIDKSFVDDIIDHSNQGAMVKTIIDMGSNLNFKVIAEGIEKEAQVEFLKKNACEIGQGYYFSKPLPTEQVGRILAKDFNQNGTPD